jgi:pyruvate dehydrogenase E1 component
MFGFQRVGDQIWAAADQRARGFLLGATSGRTTLGGEGLQHQDGTSHLIAATIPNCKAYDPAFAGEMAVIVDAGIREMLVEQQDVFYYVTLMNENYAQPSIPDEMHGDVLSGCYLFGRYPAASTSSHVTLMGSGAILVEVVRAAQLLAASGIGVDVFSVTSWSELAREGRARQVAGLGSGVVNDSFVAQQLARSSGPVVAASDYVRSVPESIRAFVPDGRPYVTLGTDGFGRSDTRAALRDFFGVDAASIARAARLAVESEAAPRSRSARTFKKKSKE